MAGGTIIVPWASNGSQVVPGGGQAASFKSASDVMGATARGNDGLDGLAKGLGRLGGAMFEIGIKDRQERRQLALLQDVRNFHRASDQFMATYRERFQGAEAGEAAAAYQAWSNDTFTPLREKWAAVSPEMEAYVTAQAGGIAAGGLDSMMGYQVGETEKWYNSAVDGEMARVEEMARRPGATEEQLTQAWNTVKPLVTARSRRNGLSPEAARAEADRHFQKLRAAKFAGAFQELLKADPKAARAFMESAKPVRAAGLEPGTAADGVVSDAHGTAPGESFVRHSGESRNPSSPKMKLVDTLFSPEEQAELNRRLVQAEDDETVRTHGDAAAAAFDSGSDAEIAAQVRQGFDEIGKVNDPDRRKSLESRLRQDLDFYRTRRAAADGEATEKFWAQAREQGLSPSRMKAALRDAPGFSRTARESLLKKIDEGTADKSTPENRAALDRLRVDIDRRQLANHSPMTGPELDAYAWRHGLTVEQVSAAREYRDSGGLSGQKGLAGKVDALYKELTGGNGKSLPPGFLDTVADRLPPGKPAAPEELRRAVADLLTSGITATEDIQQGIESRADIDFLKAAREQQYGPGAAGVQGAAHSIAEVPRSIGHGAIAAVNEALQTVIDVTDWLSGQQGLREEARRNAPDALKYLGEKPEIDLPNFDAPNTPAGETISKISQFLTGFLAAGEVLKPIQAAGKAGQFAKAAAQGAFSDFAFFDPHEERLSNLIQSFPGIANPVTEFLAAKEDDGQLEGRLKNAFEGVFLGAGLDGAGKIAEWAGKGVGAVVRAVKKVRAAKAAAEAGPEAAEAVFRGMNETAAPEPKTLSSLGDIDGPMVGERSPAGPAAAEIPLNAGSRVAEIDALEAVGFRVDREVFEAPVAMDGKRRFGVTRATLEKEGALGDRWTRIETKPEDWPAMPEKKGLRGEIAKVWRKFGRPIYDKVRGEYKIDKTGETIIVGKEGRKHIFGQSQTPEAIKSLPHLPEILKKAFKTGEYNPKPKTGANPDSRIKTLYHSAVTIDGLPYDVQIVASRREDGVFILDLYDVRAREKTARPAATHDMPGIPVETDPTMMHTGLAGKVETDGVPRPEDKATGLYPENLSNINVADFFDDVKDIVDEVPAAKAAAEAGPEAAEAVFRGMNEAAGTPVKAVQPGREFRETDAATSIALREKSQRPEFLTPYTAEEMKGWKHFVTNDGAGFTLTDKMDIIGVVNNSGRKNAGVDAVIEAIAKGGKTLDCADGRLADYYRKFGFTEKWRSTWNETRAPRGWNYDKYGRPDIIGFEYPEGLSRDREDILRRFEDNGGRQSGRGSVGAELGGGKHAAPNAGTREGMALDAPGETQRGTRTLKQNVNSDSSPSSLTRETSPAEGGTPSSTNPSDTFRHSDNLPAVHPEPPGQDSIARSRPLGAGSRPAEIDALEAAGFRVDREAFEAPVAMDGKRLYGISRQQLEAEGRLGDRWTNITTNPGEWPEKPAMAKGLRGKIAHVWREAGRAAYNKVRGIYAVDKTGERLVVGEEGGRHLLGQNQTAEAIQSLPHLPEIIKKAFKVGEYNPHLSSAAKPDMRRTVIYRSAVMIDGKHYSVQLVAKRTERGVLELDFYDLRAQGKTGRSAETRVLPEGPVEPSPAPILTDLPVKGTSAGTHEMSNGPTGYSPAPESGGLSETNVADFFDDVKDIVDEVPAAKAAAEAGPEAAEAVFRGMNEAAAPAPKTLSSLGRR